VPSELFVQRLVLTDKEAELVRHFKETGELRGLNVYDPDLQG
jgi:hypothetical protein